MPRVYRSKSPAPLTWTRLDLDSKMLYKLSNSARALYPLILCSANDAGEGGEIQADPDRLLASIRANLAVRGHSGERAGRMRAAFDELVSAELVAVLAPENCQGSAKGLPRVLCKSLKTQHNVLTKGKGERGKGGQSPPKAKNDIKNRHEHKGQGEGPPTPDPTLERVSGSGTTALERESYNEPEMPKAEYMRRADTHKMLMRTQPGYVKLYHHVCDLDDVKRNGAWFHHGEMGGRWDGTKVVGASTVSEVLRAYGIEGQS